MVSALYAECSLPSALCLTRAARSAHSQPVVLWLPAYAGRTKSASLGPPLS